MPDLTDNERGLLANPRGYLTALVRPVEQWREILGPLEPHDGIYRTRSSIVGICVG